MALAILPHVPMLCGVYTRATCSRIRDRRRLLHIIFNSFNFQQCIYVSILFLPQLAELIVAYVTVQKLSLCPVCACACTVFSYLKFYAKVLLSMHLCVSSSMFYGLTASNSLTVSCYGSNCCGHDA